MDAQLETLTAWLDGEPVSRAEVSRALETIEGREYVMDVMALRHMVAVTAPADTVTPDVHPRRRHWLGLTAAAAILLCAGAGFAAGRLMPQPAPASNSSSTIVPIHTPVTIEAPKPTRVIQLIEGTDWRETVGGN